MIKFIILTVLMVLNFFSCQASINESQILATVERGILSSPLVNSTVKKAQLRHAQHSEDINTLVTKTKQGLDAYEGPNDLEKMPELIQQKLIEWKTLVTDFKVTLTPFNASSSFQLKSQKNVEHLDHAIELTNTQFSLLGASHTAQSFLDNLLEDRTPQGFSYQDIKHAIEGNATNCFASGRGGALFFYTLSAYSVLTKKSLQDCLNELYGPQWVEQTSTFVQPIDLPEGFNPNNEFVKTMSQGAPIFLAFGNGYEFGGSRTDTHSHKEWWIKSQDCSSLAAAIANCAVPASTPDLATYADATFLNKRLAYKGATEHGHLGAATEKFVRIWNEHKAGSWASNMKERPALTQAFPNVSYVGPASIEDLGQITFDRIQPGDFLLEKRYCNDTSVLKYDQSNAQENLYKNGCQLPGGHITQVIGTIGDKVLTIGANREVGSLLSVEGQFPYGGIDYNLGLSLREAISANLDENRRTQRYFLAPASALTIKADLSVKF